MNRLLQIIFFLPILTLGQDLCSDKNIAHNKRKIEKAQKKGHVYDKEYAIIAYDIGECYRQKGDTSSITWYKKSVDIYKGLYIHYKKAEDKIFSLKMTAYSYYYSMQYADAQSYFAKCLTFCRDKQINLNDYLYYYGDCQLKLKDYTNALKTFTEYKEKKDDRHNVEGLIKECQDKLNAK